MSADVTLKIVVGGDLGPVGRVQDMLVNGDTHQVFGPVAEAFEQADFAVVNLECPLANAPTPIPKPGLNFLTSVECAAAFRDSGIGALGLANNHIMDQGWRGLESTLRACHQVGLETFGAGRNLEAADRWLIKRIGGVRVAFAAMCEREWCFGGLAFAGAAPLDPIRFTRLISVRRKSFDYLIVLLHGGAEYHPLPSPRLQDTCRFLVEQGADVVVCQHSHIAGACETFRGRPIVYGQGNLLAPRSRGGQVNASWNLGFLAELTIRHCTGKVELKRIPYVQCRETPGIRRMLLSEAGPFAAESDRLDALVADPDAVLRAWVDYCTERRVFYWLSLRGNVGWRRRILRRLGLTDQFVPMTVRRALLNLLRCDAHREALEQILESSCGWPDPGSCADQISSNASLHSKVPDS